MIKLLIISILLMTSCSSFEESERDRQRKRNAKGEYVIRKSDEIRYYIPAPRHRVREKYPWEEK